MSVPSELYKNSMLIVAALIIDKGSVVLIQEANRAYEGQWYIPAGKVERGETLVEAVKREALEEAGLQVEPLEVVYIENFPRKNFQWVRIAMTAKVVGGQLKTPEQKDKESIQAQFVPIDQLLNFSLPKTMQLRGSDFFAMLEAATERLRGIAPPVVPSTLSKFDRVRFMLLDDSGSAVLAFADDANELALYLFRETAVNLTAGESFVYAALKYVFETFDVRSHCVGTIRVEFSGDREFEGLRLTLLLQSMDSAVKNSKLKLVSKNALISMLKKSEVVPVEEKTPETTSKSDSILKTVQDKILQSLSTSTSTNIVDISPEEAKIAELVQLDQLNVLEQSTILSILQSSNIEQHSVQTDTI